MNFLACQNGRVFRPELLGSADPESAAENLRDLSRMNRHFGVHAILRGLMREIVAPGESFSMIDVGSASGDLATLVRSEYDNARVLSVDRRLHHLHFAEPPRIAADAGRLPFPEGTFDIVLCSLLLHEFPDEEAARLLSRLFRLSRRALVVLDLLRHPFAYYFLPATSWLFRWGEITLHDGPVSVEAGFQRAELERLAERAGLDRSRVRSHPPWFRLSLVARR